MSVSANIRELWKRDLQVLETRLEVTIANFKYNAIERSPEVQQNVIRNLELAVVAMKDAYNELFGEHIE